MMLTINHVMLHNCVIVGLKSGHVATIPKTILDPRRSMDVTDEMKYANLVLLHLSHSILVWPHLSHSVVMLLVVPCILCVMFTISDYIPQRSRPPPLCPRHWGRPRLILEL